MLSLLIRVGSTTSLWHWYCWFYHFTVALVFSNSCINPFIYAAKYREFQHGVRRLMTKMKLQQPQSQVSAIT